MKRIICLILIVLLVFSLTACGQEVQLGNVSSVGASQQDEEKGGNKGTEVQDDGQNINSQQGSPSSSATTQSAVSSNTFKPSISFVNKPEAAKPKVPTYNVSTQVAKALKDSGSVDAYSFKSSEKDFAEYFEKEYGAELTLRRISWEQYSNSFFVEYAANDAPDVVLLQNKTWPKMAMRYNVYSISELKALGVVGLDHPALDESNALNKRITAYKGQVYGIGTHTNVPNVIIVNNDVLAACGVTKTPSMYFEEGKWTYANFLEVCKKVASVDKNNDDMADYYPFYGWDYRFFLQMNNVEIISVDSSGKLVNNIESAGVKKAMQMIRDAKANGYFASSSSSIANNRLAMLATASSSAAREIEDMYVGMGAAYAKKFSVVPFPEVTKGKSITGGAYYAYAVNNATKNPQGAVNYIIAREIYTKGETPNESSDLSVWLNDKGDLWLKALSQKTTPTVFDCVGTLYTEQWNFWAKIVDKKWNLDEAIGNFKDAIDSQIELENSNIYK